MAAQAGLQAGPEALALGLGRLDQVALAQDPEHGPAGGGPDHVVGVGEAVGEAAGADGVVDGPGGDGQPQRPVAGGGPLGQDQDVGPDGPVVAGEPAAGPPEPGHDLVGDHQHAVAAADLGHRRPVVVGGDGRPQAGPGDRLGHERGHRARGRGQDLPLQGLGVAGPAAGRVGVAERAAVLVGGQGVVGQAEPGQVRAAQRPAAADVQRPSGVAVVAALAADHPRSGPRPGPGGRRGPS